MNFAEGKFSHQPGADAARLAFAQQALAVGASGSGQDGGTGCWGVLNLQAVTNDAPSANQHQAVNQLGGTGRGQGAVNDDQSLLLGFCQVRGNGWAITRCAGNQGVQRSAPGVHRVGDQVDVF